MLPPPHPYYSSIDRMQPPPKPLPLPRHTAARLAIARARTYLIRWRDQTRYKINLVHRTRIAAAACLALRISLCLYWSFGAVLTAWRSRPLIVAAHHCRRRRRRYDLLIFKRWQRNARTRYALASIGTELEQRVVRRRVCHLHPCLQRWRLRAQTEQLEKQLLAVAAWRNAARRGLRSLCAVARARHVAAAARHAATAVALAMALRGWSRGAHSCMIARHAERVASRHILQGAISRWQQAASLRGNGVMLRRVAKMAIKRTRYRLGLRAFAAAYDTATVSRERRHFYLMRYRYVACRRAIGIWIRRVKDPWKRVASRVAGVLDQPRLLAGAPATGGYADLVAVLSPLVHRLGTLFSQRRLLHIFLQVWRVVARVEHALLRLPHARGDRVFALCFLRWRRHARLLRLFAHNLSFAQLAHRRVTLGKAWRRIRREARRLAWPQAVSRALDRRKKLLGMRVWRIYTHSMREGDLREIMVLDGLRLRKKRALLRWVRCHLFLRQIEQRNSLRAAAAIRFHVKSTRKRWLMRWRKINARRVRERFLPQPPMLTPLLPQHLRPAAFAETSSGGEGLAETPRPPSAMPSSPARGGYNSRRIDARGGATETAPAPPPSSSLPRSTIKSAAPLPSRLDELEQQDTLRFRKLWDGRQACRRWRAAAQTTKYLTRRREAARHVAAQHDAPGGRGSLGWLQRALGMWHAKLRRQRAVALFAGRGGGEHARRLRSALAAWMTGVSEDRLGILAAMHAIAVHAPNAGTIRINAAHEHVSVARAIVRWRLNFLTRCVVTARAVQHAASHPFRRSLSRRLLRGLRLAASIPVPVETKPLMRAMELWTSRSHVVMYIVKLTSTADAALTLNSVSTAFRTWHASALDRGLLVKAQPLEPSRTKICGRAMSQWRLFAADAAIGERLLDAAWQMIGQRAWKRWLQYASAVRAANVLAEGANVAALRSAIALWCDYAEQSAEDAVMEVSVALMSSRVLRQRGLRGLQLHALWSCLLSAAIRQGDRRMLADSWHRLRSGIILSKRDQKHTNLGYRSMQRLKLRVWHERTAGSAMSRMRRKMHTWPFAPAEIEGQPSATEKLRPLAPPTWDVARDLLRP